MINRLPYWAWTGAWVLAFAAGTVNVVGLLGFEHQAITHLTGSTSLLAIGLATGDTRDIFHFAGILVSFVTGTVVSGFIIQGQAFQLGRCYGLALLLESALLFIAVPLLNRHELKGLYCAACACGLQNAMMTTYSGTIIRTTHVSGMITDLGITLGNRLRSLPVDVKRVRMCLFIISGFLCGGIIGAVAYHGLQADTLFIPAGITAAMSIGYGIYRLRKKFRR